MEHLSDASFLIKLLALPANVRLDWKVIVRYKHSSLFGLIVSDEEEINSINLDTRARSTPTRTMMTSKKWTWTQTW